jgi:hypothetical protein
MTELQVGDKIKTSDENGNFGFSPVITLPHKAGNSEMAKFLKLTTESGKAVRMTPGHLLPNCAGELLPASQLQIGDCLITVDGKETLVEISTATKFGVYTAITAHKYIVADGFVASPFSIENDQHQATDEPVSSFIMSFLENFKTSMGLRGSRN